MLRSSLMFSAVTVFVIGASAQEETDDTQHQILVDDLRVVESKHDYQTTVQRVKDTLTQHEGIRLMNKLDLAKESGESGINLPPTHLFVFGSPKLGTRLMTESPTAGLDLPQQLVVYEKDGTTFLAYNTAEYLAARHALEEVDETLNTIAREMDKLALTATDREEVVPQPDAMDLSNDRGILTVEASGSVDEATAELEKKLQDDEAIAYVTVIDHAKNAKETGSSLPPTRLIVAGHGEHGLELLKAAPTAGVDLPLKFLVFEDAEDGKTYIAWNDPEYLALRHDIDGEEDVLKQMAQYQQKTAGELGEPVTRQARN